MASFLARRLNPRLLLQNPNPSSLSSHFQSTTTFRALPEPISTNFIKFYPCSSTIKPNFPTKSFCSNPVQILLRREPIPSWFTSQLGRQFSSAPPEKPDSGDAEKQTQVPEFKHQEIVGPTVERDDSALANETRKVLDALRKSTYDLSSALVLLGFANLGLGAWIAYAIRPPEVVLIQGLGAFTLPFSVAFLMRRTLKPMSFFRKMEEQGRLQILTLALQVFKSLNLLFLRTRVVAFSCAMGLTLGTTAVLLSRQGVGSWIS